MLPWHTCIHWAVEKEEWNSFYIQKKVDINEKLCESSANTQSYVYSQSQKCIWNSQASFTCTGCFIKTRRENPQPFFCILKKMTKKKKPSNMNLFRIDAMNQYDTGIHGTKLL